MGELGEREDGSSLGSHQHPLPPLGAGTWMTRKANSGLLWGSHNGLFCSRCKLAPKHLALMWEHPHSTFSFVCGTVYTERTGVFRCWMKRHFILEYSNSGCHWNKHCRQQPKYNQDLCKTENRGNLITSQTAGWLYKWALLTDWRALKFNQSEFSRAQG